ncbi:hypothetical protein SBOR_8674 [Sclerotinia borealis F-4128]|uniref:Zn(2)-C6 fungal-type domain-containing protein n=1 Tax=Sclerotinia borealis (strain F-4128) TaxID=1432307 RepID=W9C5D9_SCLBF|nr:hypothetical protein SBOR_8674 [Sclerotinia borealis F-4128]
MANVIGNTERLQENFLRRVADSPIVAAYNQPYLAPGFDLELEHQYLQSNPSPLYSGSASTISDLTIIGDQQYASPNYPISGQSSKPTKRQKIDGKPRQIKVRANINNQMPGNDASSATAAEATTTAANKPKRVRTGCLTCRERHLKCDEGLPNCQNCRKSSRECKRGVRLNFIDTQVKSPPIIPPTADWAVQFQDESREIASEYKGGLSRYAHIDRTMTPPREPTAEYPMRPVVIDPMMQENALPPIQTTGTYMENNLGVKHEMVHSAHSRHTSRHLSHAGSEGSSYLTAPTTYSNSDQIITPPNETRDYLTAPEEVLFMQVFVEEVGIWMDSMDPMKHFSRILPFHSLGEPMLLNAFLACGARHLTLVNPIYHEDKALYYYDTATTQLLRSLQNPDRDTVICATTAVILNVYEIMSERAMQRMNHIAGARALIKECGWNARSTGVGAACFWLNVGMELLSCLHFNWQVAWEPDQWGVDMDFSRESEVGREEIWVHRMLYIIGKIANFRASMPRFQEASPHDEHIRMQSSIPRTMHPMAYLYPSQTASKSAFPEVWLIKRATIVGRLFYHTAMCLLPQINPLLGPENEEMHEMQQSHSHNICGIVAHVKDRGVASVALRSLAIAAECLVIRREQEEVLDIFEKIRKETGWRVGFLYKELKSKWGWPDEAAQQQQMMSHSNTLPQFFPLNPQAPTSSLPPAPPAPPLPRPSISSGILNPLLKTADFSLPNHPYKQYYQPPNTTNQFTHTYL